MRKGYSVPRNLSWIENYKLILELIYEFLGEPSNIPWDKFPEIIKAMYNYGIIGWTKANKSVSWSVVSRLLAVIQKQKKILNKKLIKEIAHLRKSEDAELWIISKAVQQQGNGYDFRVFAIAFATDIAYNHKPEQRTYSQSVMRKHLLAHLETKQWHHSKSNQSELNVEKKLHITSHYIANPGCHSLKMIRRKTKVFSWRFVQFAQNGTTRE